MDNHNMLDELVVFMLTKSKYKATYREIAIKAAKYSPCCDIEAINYDLTNVLQQYVSTCFDEMSVEEEQDAYNALCNLDK